MSEETINDTCLAPATGGSDVSERPTATHWPLTAQLWAFGALKIPLMFYLRPRILALSETSVALEVRLRRRTRNHRGTMYFGALATGAELVPGIFCNTLGRRLGRSVSFG